MLRNVGSVVCWRAATKFHLFPGARGVAHLELRIRATLAEARLADLKATLDDVRSQRDHWQAMAQRLTITD